MKSSWSPGECANSPRDSYSLPHVISKPSIADRLFQIWLFSCCWLSYHRNHTWHQRSHGAAFQSHHPLQQETRQDSQVGSSPNGTHLSRTARNNILVLLEEAKKSEMLAQFLLTLNLQGLKGRNNSLKDTLMPWFIIWFMLVAIYLSCTLYSDGSLIARYCPSLPSQDRVLRSMCWQESAPACLPLSRKLLPPLMRRLVQWNCGSAASSSFCRHSWPGHHDIFEISQFLLVLIWICF